MAYGIDCGINCRNFEKWNAVVKLFAIISEYEKHGSYARTAEVFGVSEIIIKDKLLAFGYPKINEHKILSDSISDTHQKIFYDWRIRHGIRSRTWRHLQVL